MDDLRPPIVTDVDRKWALDQCPPWAVVGGDEADADEPGEIIDETEFERSARLKAKRERPKVFRWDWFVDDQADSFERFFKHERKSSADWSGLWRRSWWPKADPRKRLPRSMSKLIPTKPHPFARKGTPAFAVALKLANETERKLFVRVGVAQFAPDDPRAEKLVAVLAKSERAA